MIRSVTYNLGCGGPHGADCREAADSWIDTATGAHDLIFAQEIPAGDDWTEHWEKAGFRVVLGPAKGWRTRSALIVRSKAVRGVESVEYPTAEYHGTYLAAAALDLGWVEPFVVVSVHASPQRVSDDWARSWITCGRELPVGRPSCGLWDADLVLATIAELCTRHRFVIAAGDWNEARGWDLTHHGHSGREFFERVEDAGLVDVTYEQWGRTERSTRDGLQLDRVFATRAVAERIRDAAVTAVEIVSASDHHPVEFTIDATIGTRFAPDSEPDDGSNR